jgi:drug/metabolite transporter (DMT)-like permease
MTHRLKAYLALLLTAAIWGIAGPVIKYTLYFLPPFTFLFYRFLMVSLFSLPFLLYLWKKSQINLSDLPKLFLLGLMSTTINLSLIFLGFERTTALDGTLLSSITPIFIVIGGALLFKDKVTKLEKVGLLVVLFGALITVIQPLLEKGAFAQENLLGNLLILIAGLQWTAYVLLAKDDLKRHSPLVLTVSAGLVGLLTFLPLACLEQGGLILESNWLNPNAFWGVFYMAILSYLLAYFLYNFGISKIEVSEAAIFSYLQPVFAAPFAVFWLKETITFPFLLGAGIIFLGVVLSEYRPNRFASTQKKE